MTSSSLRILFLLVLLLNIFIGISMQNWDDCREITIQKRTDGSVDFYRPWSDYKRGFGDSSNFFLGLDEISRRTNSCPHELLCVMENWDGDRRYANYDSIIVGGEGENYKLKILGKYTGSAGDSLSYSVGQNFTTIDRDNDAWVGNCAIRYTGAWWYKDCHQCNPNGLYGNNEFGKGINWLTFMGYNYSMKSIELILKPKCSC
ncbi:ryncolin-4-like [Musca domestica]|uniref:Ryncolin-4-like n=2 Tax=Musca domestica TaxID=7370 RepID=A0A9J7I2E0_MUSDO|nr:ryncolin-4-like [Musca domestica]